MKRHAMQQAKSTAQTKSPLAHAQAVNELKLRVLQAKGGFLSLGTASYMAFIEAQALKEGKHLDASEKVELRRCMNANLGIEDAERVELIVRALEAQLAA